MENFFAFDAATANGSPNPDEQGQIPKRNGRAKGGSPAEVSRRGPGTMDRTKKLIAAAIKVWELKRGIRD